MEIVSSPIPIPVAGMVFGFGLSDQCAHLQYLCVPFSFSPSPPGYPMNWIPVQPHSPPAYASPSAGQFYGISPVSSPPLYQTRRYSMYPPLPVSSVTIMTASSVETREFSYSQSTGTSSTTTGLNVNGSYNYNTSFQNLRMNNTVNGFNSSYSAGLSQSTTFTGSDGVTVAGRREYGFIAEHGNMPGFPTIATTSFQRTGSEVSVSATEAFGVVFPRLRAETNRRRHCKFCRSNKETREFYESHALRNRNGMIQCPVLRKYVCPVCNATGDNAHTLAYCPANRDEMGRIKVGSGRVPKSERREVTPHVRYVSE